MITAVHTLVYADDVEATRAFFRDVLQWPNVDAHGGWLIFRTGASEMGVHPTSAGVEDATWSAGRHHEISFMCDDIEQTMAELAERGAEFSGGISDQRYGRTVMLRVPGADDIMLYEPLHPTAFDLDP